MREGRFGLACFRSRIRFGGAGLARIDGDRGDETIASAGKRLYICRVVGRIAERLADLIDRAGEAALEIDGCVVSPYFVLELFAGENFARSSQESGEQTKGLSCEANTESGFANFLGVEIDLEDPERHDLVSGDDCHAMYSQ